MNSFRSNTVGEAVLALISAMALSGQVRGTGPLFSEPGTLLGPFVVDGVLGAMIPSRAFRPFGTPSPDFHKAVPGMRCLIAN